VQRDAWNSAGFRNQCGPISGNGSDKRKRILVPMNIPVPRNGIWSTSAAFDFDVDGGVVCAAKAVARAGGSYAVGVGDVILSFALIGASGCGGAAIQARMIRL